jgi:hypothetical protein
MFHRFQLIRCVPALSASLLATALASSIAISGCATTETTEAPKLPRRFVSTVSSSTGLFVPSKNSPIQWDGTVEITDSARLLTADRTQLVTSTLKEEMKNRGYQFSATAAGARFAMKAVLLMGKDADKQQLNALSGVAPELKEGGDTQSGALGVYFTDTDTQQIVWKSATEIVTRSQLSEEAQIERIRYAVQQMLSGLPAAK